MAKLEMLHKTGLPFVMAIVAVIGIMFGAGCEKKELETPPASQTEPTEQQTETHRQSIVNTSWKLVAFVENNVSRTPESGINSNPFLLIFYQEKISGVACVNEINGSFSCNSENDTISIQVGTMTYAYECEDGFSYLDRLNESSTYNIDGDTLKIYVNEKNYLVFERISPPSFLIGEWAVNASMSFGINNNYTDTLLFTDSGSIRKHSVMAGSRYFVLNDSTIRIENTYAYTYRFKYYSPNGIMFYNFIDNTVTENIKNIYYERVIR